MLLALEVDHGHRQRVRQLATRLGEGERSDQEADDRGSRLPRPRHGSPRALWQRRHTNRGRTIFIASRIVRYSPSDHVQPPAPGQGREIFLALRAAKRTKGVAQEKNAFVSCQQSFDRPLLDSKLRVGAHLFHTTCHRRANGEYRPPRPCQLQGAVQSPGGTPGDLWLPPPLLLRCHGPFPRQHVRRPLSRHIRDM